jgi:hypothetical protein
MPSSQELLVHHLEQLAQGSGIAPEVIAERGYRSISGPEGYTELKRLGFSRQQAKQTPGLLIPILGLDGQPALYQYRPDSPRINTKGRTVKYETPTQQTMRLDFGTGQRDLISKPVVGLWITEGAKKLDALRSHGLCGISLLGVWSWRGTNLDGGKAALADWEQVPLNHRDVYLCFDSDVTTKPEVQQALNRLRRFLAQRGARVTVVHLPANGAEKVGVDDYLLRHTIDDLQALAHPQPSDELPTPAPTLPPYRATSRGLAWLKPTRDGDISVPLTNFTARIVDDIVSDDGTETTRQFALEATLNGRTHRFTVAAAQFPSLGWVSEYLGAQAMVYPGQTLKDHTRAAIQFLSDGIVERRVFAHTGWRRNRDGVWYYFHGGGVLGQNGQVPQMEVSLPSGLERFILPDPPLGEALVQAVRASHKMLDPAPDPVTVPLWASILRAVLGGADFGIHLTGPTGTAKTELATLAQQHFGAMFDARHLPGSWLSTGNSLEDLAFTAKDAILVIDDFAPGGTTADIARTHREADRVLRAQGNQAGRQRMRADGTLRPAKPPRGLIISTGEDVPRGQSLRARLVIIEVSPGDVDWTHLTACQQEAASGLYAQAMAGYIQWLAPRYDHIRDHLTHDVGELRAQFYQHGQHQRSVSNIASLAVGIRHWLLFTEDIGAITSVEREALWQRCWTALLRVSAQQQRYQDASEPTQHFLRLVSAALASGRTHLAHPTGEVPEIPQAYGWRAVTLGTGPYVTNGWQPQGRRIGWVNGEDLYLEPDASYAEAQVLAVQQGEGLGVSAQTLRKRLHDRHLLVTTGKASEGRDTLQVRRNLEGRRRDVLHLRVHSLALDTSEKPDQPDQPPAGPVNGQVFPDPWSGNGEGPDHDNTLTEKVSGDSGQVGQVSDALKSHHSEEGKNHDILAISWSSDEKNLTTKPDHTTSPDAWEDL